MDISDGLLDDLGKLCRASNVGATLDASAIPVDQAVQSAYPDESLALALSGGEDYQLLFAAPSESVQRVADLTNVQITIIGTIADGAGVTILDKDGKPLDIMTGGWDHFADHSTENQ
jgi:thiamine-monophosphate kinase